MSATLPAPASAAARLVRRYLHSRAFCEWEHFDAWAPALLQAAADERVPPFALLSLPGIDAQQQRWLAGQWMQARLAPSRAARAEAARQFAGLPRPAQRGGRIRVGYLSNDFHQHATALLMVEMLEAHDRSAFELHALSYGADCGRGMRQRLQAATGQFHDITALDDGAAARHIHGLGIDLLVDLKGYTAGTRARLLGWRAAPVQVSYLGYPGTLGSDCCDYLISDRFVTPPGSDGAYSEALACLPHSYQPHGRAAGAAGAASAAAGQPPTRAAAGLPETGLVLCCFNQAWKFTPAVFDRWCRLLEALPGSVLWLLHDAQAEGQLRGEALRRGVMPQRLVFAPPLPQDQHLARLALADLVLDTLPYNAHTTASDALWMGVPLVTCAGNTFAGRVAGSLLRAAGLPELVTHDLDAYEQLALALGRDAPRLAQLRRRLAGLRAAAPLFDVARYTRDLEALYTTMWQRHCRGQAPVAIGALA
ncbi:O-linked N-acetylglucosamine transferase, SPINDLY family protein [Aquabacterium sp. OR-4]|uniref:O-linked N-acetylglucosamine transferase, SPINDLY family protein n=1 Tax=Aquabacterium sp. OR-4 TaxID=2978127 RepID=UPI0028CA769C|nr:UDP-N-acetylglucosamine-peptide N-acetylglucosaminyltransferase [Aquabacterium sp. OR-4]MDT7838780.1 UDP-N-acetylglucosamine-peptide N-acetylglucosaminyltransferase [Aquabacterium sp. OR-4]